MSPGPASRTLPHALPAHGKQFSGYQCGLQNTWPLCEGLRQEAIDQRDFGQPKGGGPPLVAIPIFLVSPGKAAKLRKAGLLVESSPQACRDTHSRHHAPSPPPTCQHPHQAQRSSPEPSSALRTSGGSHGPAPPCSFH